MVTKKKAPITLLVGLASCLAGMVIAHFVWYFAILGLIESDVNAALLAGTGITGVFEYAERYEDSYLAHVSTNTFGEVTIKIPADVARDLSKGTQVKIVSIMSIVELKETGDMNA